MDYTREPIIESVVTSRDGCKLVIRSSKGMSQEEYFVDAVELVSFGAAIFFRSLEKPKPFLLPVQDYEVVEVREPRMVLKNVGIDRSIKIGSREKASPPPPKPPQKEESPEEQPRSTDDKQKRQRRHRRRGKGQSELEMEEQPATLSTEEVVHAPESAKAASSIPPSALLAPPTTLISETLVRYRRDEAFKQAFYEKEADEEELQLPPASLPASDEFDEGDNILFRGHEPPRDFKPYAEESLEESNEHHFEPKEDEETNPLIFEDHDQQL